MHQKQKSSYVVNTMPNLNLLKNEKIIKNTIKVKAFMENYQEQSFLTKRKMSCPLILIDRSEDAKF